MCRPVNYSDMDQYMKKNNLTIEGYLQYIGKNNVSFLNMSVSAYRLFSKNYKKLQQDIDNFEQTGEYKLSSQERGKILEEIAGCLFYTNNSVFSEKINCRTNTNEIDILVKWDKIAIQAGLNRLYPYMESGFLCECKNYSSSVKVTYVGKFYSLLKTCDAKFGILFSRKGLSGKNNWQAGKGLARKIALKEDVYIIDITFDDLKAIYERKTNILTIIDEKYEAMKNDISYEDYIKQHDLQERFEKKMIELSDLEKPNSKL